MMNCSVCQQEMKITKTNTELKMHAEGKHGKTIDDCFPGAQDVAADMAAAEKAKGGSGGAGGGPTKAEKKKKAATQMDDLLSAGLSTGKKKGKK